MHIKRKPLGKPKYQIGTRFKDSSDGSINTIIAIEHPRSYTFIYLCRNEKGHEFKIEQWIFDMFDILN